MTRFKFFRINVDSNDAGSSGFLTAHDGRKANGTEAEHSAAGPGFHLRRVQCRAVSRRYATAKQTHFIQSRTAIHLTQNSIQSIQCKHTLVQRKVVGTSQR